VGNKVVARVTLDASGQARFTRSFAPRRLFNIRAVYSGDAHFAASSQSLTEHVKRSSVGAAISMVRTGRASRRAGPSSARSPLDGSSEPGRGNARNSPENP
jgi:hypothetical protein